MKNFLLYSISTLIWGSTWLGIKFQLGAVDPMVSVAYRFLLAAGILLAYCFLARLKMRFSIKDHAFFLMEGIFLFAINYWLVYLAELHLPSGLVAVVFTTIVCFNIFNGAIFLKSPVHIRMILGAIIGFAGVSMVFKDEISSFSLSSANFAALLTALCSAFMASIGNIISARNHKHGIPVIQSTAIAMFYGAIGMVAISCLAGKAFTFENTFPYISSLLYLAIFGSILAFSAYLSLIGNIGADRAAYVTLVIPIIALVLSTIFEDYVWKMTAIVGVMLVLSGNLMIVDKNLYKKIRFPLRSRGRS